MFRRLGRSVYRLRWIVVVVAVGVALATGALAWGVTGALRSGGLTDEAADSSLVSRRLEAEFGTGGTRVFAVYTGEPGSRARSAEFQAGIEASLARLVEDPLVVGTTGFGGLPDDRFISLDGAGAVIAIDLAVSAEEAADDIERLRSLIEPIEGVEVDLTGFAAITHDTNVLSERDLQRAELVSLPLALLILIVVFTSIVAAGMPLLVASLAITTTLGVVAVLAQRTEMSVFVLNMASMLGLALAIDYSLFIVSRFREELARGRSTAEAVERSVATAGRAVVFSALVVAIGLSGLLLFKSWALTSMGTAGIIVVIASAVYAVTFLPAVLGMLGPRVNALNVAALYRRIGIRGKVGSAGMAPGAPSARWLRMAGWVMAHPVRVLVPTLTLLLVLGLPFLQMRQAVPDAAVFPAGIESRDGFVTLQTRFSAGETSPLIILADVPGDPTSEGNVRALASYAQALGAIEGITRVDSPFGELPNPLTGDNLSVEQVVVAYQEATLRERLDPLLDRYVRGSTVRLDAISPLGPSSAEVPALVAAVRALPAGEGITTTVGGGRAVGEDFLAGIDERTPYMLGTVTASMLAALFLLFGSVLLPVKAVLMTLLSIVASFGALVWIFQMGNLEEVFGFQAPGYTIAGNPIVMFAVLIGLSMDYEVLMLTRIQESWERTGDNTRAVAEGLSRTAGVISGAALIMVVVFASFALADVITIKALGLGMAIAVFLDATVVRILLVPATMRLLGKWNWWAPAPLQRLADRIGFNHVSDPQTPAEHGLEPTVQGGGAPS